MKQELAFMVLLLVGSADSQYKGCDYFQAMKPGKLYSIATKKIGRSSNCRWSAEAPPGYRISLVCHEVNLPSTLLCRGDEIMVSISGRADLRGGKRHCGNASFIETTISRKITVALKSRSGELKCSLKAIANVSNSCTCGQQNRGRIVGGGATRVNEYPSMAGVVDAREKRIFCGSTIISTTYALTAAHCMLGMLIVSLGLLVGEHDITKGSETPYTALHKISSVLSHPSFNRNTNANDIALIRTKAPLTFNRGVQAACLPFKYRIDSLVNRPVQALGWGSTEFGGPSSHVLKQVTLTVVSKGNCTSNQICSLAQNADTCQSDSGGPLLFIDNNIIFHVGIVSFGIACASDQPSVNTRVASYLDWILQNTRSTDYCVK